MAQRNGRKQLQKRQSQKKKKAASSRPRGGHPLRGIQQGVGQTVPRPFGSTTGNVGVFTATCPAHLALPVATGPYTVMRVTQLITSDKKVMAFGTFRGAYTNLQTPALTSPQLIEKEGWAPYCAVGSSLDNGVEWPTFGATFYRMSGLAELGPSATITPSALTVQLMNPEALQTTNGILYIGRMKAQFRGEDAAVPWETLANEFVSYQAPRLCSAGKLALRGITVDAAPFNIQDLQDFDRIIDPKTGGSDVKTEPWTSVSTGVATEETANHRWMMKGFSPIMVFNPQKIDAQYLVTVEFRCRFDLGHPASSTHTHHQPASPATWAGHMKRMAEMGHGVLDIADQIARMGELGQRALPYATGALALMG